MNNTAHFCIVGIRPFTPEGMRPDSELAGHIERIQKALYGTTSWLNFYRGYDIDEENGVICIDKSAKRSMSIYDVENLQVNICAVVGQNGSGKSSLIDLLLRAINNFSAAVLGEGYNFAAAEHLHYVEHVYVDVCYVLRRNMYILHVRGRDIWIDQYDRVSVYRYEKNRDQRKNILKSCDNQDIFCPLEPLRVDDDRFPEYKEILNNFYWCVNF